MLSYPTLCRSILILSSHLRLGLPSRLFLSAFTIKPLYAPFLCPKHATFPAHLILDLITQTIFGEEFYSGDNAWNVKRCYFVLACRNWLFWILLLLLGSLFILRKLKTYSCIRNVCRTHKSDFSSLCVDLGLMHVVNLGARSVTNGNFAHEGRITNKAGQSCIVPVRHAFYSVVTSINSQATAGFVLAIAYCFVTQLMIHVIWRTLTALNFLCSSADQHQRPSTVSRF
jgi:hypothetical protein